MAHSESYTESENLNNDLAVLSIDNEEQKGRRMLRERLAVDHKLESTDDGSDKWGIHKKVTFEAKIASPSLPTGSVSALFPKTGDKDSELRYKAGAVDHKIVAVGDVKFKLGSTADDGWLAVNGDSIGPTGSGATHTGDQYKDLFTYLWNELADAQFPINGGRGASADADWTAGKYGTMPDARSRMPIGAGQGAGLTSRTIGDVGGGETKDLSHTHTGTTDEDTKSPEDEGGGANTCSSYQHTHTFTTDSAGSATQDVMNPWIALTMFIKY